ncbi:RDD family protein [Pontibacter sp. G13]|uniref:RDD family protein n=1 Tax=Pontibacter sp. G13 TaxID=3074898 RepID=UPI00288BB75C|nr:RDD family protein [Pontibacter sp. G13]WNJ21370.1 RDD family protein [Pontibacter sp. G13]
MKTILIPTSQNIELEYPIAGVLPRVAASLIDLTVLILYYLIVFVGIWTAASGESFWSKLMRDGLEVNDTLFVLHFISTLPILCYSLICEGFFNGKTLGKWIMKLKVIKLDGSSPSWTDYMIRWSLRTVDVWLSSIFVFPGLVGLITMGVNKNGQRLGDILAGTTVVKLKLVTSFGDTIFMETDEEYEMVFPEIRNLSDRDVAILKEVLDAGLKSKNHILLIKLADKVKEVAKIDTKLEAREFLETVLKDYNHYFGKS